MNEDELREFLESATVDTPGKGGQSADATDAPAPRLSFEKLMQMKRAESAGDRAAAPVDPAAQDQAPTPAAAPTPPAAPSAAPTAPQDPPATEVLPQAPSATPAPVTPPVPPAAPEPELAPIILPGPPQPNARPVSNEPFWETHARAAAAAPEVPATPAAPAPTTPVPSATPATTPLSAARPEAHSQTGIVENHTDDPFGADPLPVPGVDGAGDDYERIEVVGAEKSHSKMIPWIIVGAGAILAIILAIVVVFAVRGGSAEPTETAEPTTEAPAEPTTEEPTAEPPAETSEPPAETTPPADEPPEVEVGKTGSFKIDSWGVQGEISAKFGWPSYTISNGTLTFEGGTLLPQFPDSCAAMRTGFGITKLDDGTFEVHRPAETCAEAPDFYNEVWGLTAAIVPTLK